MPLPARSATRTSPCRRHRRRSGARFSPRRTDWQRSRGEAMYAFDYRRPATLSDAERALNALSGAKLLAGGQTLIPALKLRLNRPEAVIDLGGIAGLSDIARKGDALAIGAMATHAQIGESQAVAASIAGLGRLAEGIGDPQVRNRGTIGGSLANNDPASDYPAAVLALNAKLATTKRTIAADDFFRGVFATV